ncbi:hypothetical protein PMIN07_004595 [Paraphaeosphaeria minitans]|uniref:Uncharacterized protein n=1 Tax=Paraphaeosphaeria minitans TaxID=565426 RepID=A0A9P6GDB1_9PLEO|nr:hypothetical protein PMIN01_10204 [Paraphaeosphaeria minitans]
MAQRTCVQVNQLSRAARHLQLKPCFTKVPCEEVQGALPPPLYREEWLHIVPTFRGRNRWIARGMDRATVEDVALMDARARNDLRSVAIREADYSLALQRLRGSQPHELSLNETLASLHRGEYLVEKGLLFARLLIADVDSIAQWFSSTPPHIFGPLRELHGRIVSDLMNLKHEVDALSSLLRVRLNQHLGANTVRHVAVMHELEIPIRKEHHKMYTTKKSIRRIWKQTRPPGDYSAATQDENDEFYQHTQASVRGDQEDLLALEVHADVQRTLTLDRVPARWIATSFNTWFECIMQHRWSSLRRLLYPLIKFSNSDETTPNQMRMRRRAHDSFRQKLDKQEFHLPNPYGEDGFHGQDLFTLVRELQWIRNYRIERFPESIGKDEIRLARDFYVHMRRGCYSRAHNEDVVRYIRMTNKRFAHQSSHGKGQVRHGITDKSPRRLSLHSADARREQESRVESVETTFEARLGGNQTIPNSTSTASNPLKAHVSRTAETRRVSDMESSGPPATAELPQREVPALVVALRASKAFQSAHVKTPALSNASSSLSAEPQKPQKPQPIVSRPREKVSYCNVGPRASHKATHKAAFKPAHTSMRAPPPEAKKTSRPKKVSVGTRLANLLHIEKSMRR